MWAVCGEVCGLTSSFTGVIVTTLLTWLYALILTVLSAQVLESECLSGTPQMMPVQSVGDDGDGRKAVHARSLIGVVVLVGEVTWWGAEQTRATCINIKVERGCAKHQTRRRHRLMTRHVLPCHAGLRTCSLLQHAA